MSIPGMETLCRTGNVLTGFYAFDRIEKLDGFL